MADNSIKSYNSEAFARDLSSQAVQVVPKDIKKTDADFIVDIIYRFCKMAGDALVGEENSKLNAQEASLVVQFIGEWIFHKSVDLIRANIDLSLREGILQKVAFTVFDVAKKSIEKNMAQEDLIIFVEDQVKKSFSQAIAELETKGVLSEDMAQGTLKQSNIDVMAAQQAQEQIKKEVAPVDNRKMIKLASLAILIKNFPTAKVKNILDKFDKPEREVLLNYLKMPDLEEKLDAGATIKCFENLKEVLPEAIVISFDRAYKKMYKIVKNSSQQEISSIIDYERPAVKEYVMSCYQNKKRKLPAYVADTITKYIEENT